MVEANKRSLAEARCVDLVNVDLNALEIGAVLLLARNHKIHVGIDSRAAVIVFVHFRWSVTKSCKSFIDLSARKVKGKRRGVSFWYVNPRMAETCDVLVAVSESDMSHDVFSLSRRRHPNVCVLQGMWNETEAGADRGHGDFDCKLRVHEVLEACKIMIPELFSTGLAVEVSRRWW